MKRAAPPPGIDAVSIQVIRYAIGALNDRDRKLWFEQFSDKPGFTDDGIPRDFVRWCDEELFGSWTAHLVSIDKVEDGGLTFYGKYHSDKWGDFKTFWKFVVEGGKITRLDVGATNS